MSRNVLALLWIGGLSVFLGGVFSMIEYPIPRAALVLGPDPNAAIGVALLFGIAAIAPGLGMIQNRRAELVHDDFGIRWTAASTRDQRRLVWMTVLSMSIGVTLWTLLGPAQVVPLEPFLLHPKDVYLTCQSPISDVPREMRWAAPGMCAWSYSHMIPLALVGVAAGLAAAMDWILRTRRSDVEEVRVDSAGVILRVNGIERRVSFSDLVAARLASDAVVLELRSGESLEVSTRHILRMDVIEIMEAINDRIRPPEAMTEEARQQLAGMGVFEG